MEEGTAENVHGPWEKHQSLIESLQENENFSLSNTRNQINPIIGMS